jgi:hypothetical protein
MSYQPVEKGDSPFWRAHFFLRICRFGEGQSPFSTGCNATRGELTACSHFLTPVAWMGVTDHNSTFSWWFDVVQAPRKQGSSRRELTTTVRKRLLTGTGIVMDDMPGFDPHQTCGPRLANPDDGDLPPGFFPLRLVLQPGGLCVSVTKPDAIMGRHSGADVRLSLPDISRRHCRFVSTDGLWQVLDLNSLNGVFVNGERLQEAPLRHGDRIRIGSLTFEVDLSEGMAQPGGQQAIRKAS